MSGEKDHVVPHSVAHAAYERQLYHSIHAVENPLTSLADDAERTRKMVAQQQGPGRSRTASSRRRSRTPT
jgi:hypothetical protein